MTPEEAANQVDDEECGTGMPLSSQETVSSNHQVRTDEKILHIVLDIDTDGDQILPADDEQEIILRPKNPGGDGSSHIHRVVDTDDLCDKYPDIPAATSFDTAETESSVDGSEASTDAGEISRPTNQEEDDAGNVRQLRATDVTGAVRRSFQAARKRMKDVLNWYTFVALSFLTAMAAILCVAFGEHGVAAILLFVAVSLITALICWLRLDLRIDTM